MKLIDAIGIRLQGLLDERGWSQYKLSVLSGVPRQTINLIMRRLRNTLEVDTLYQLVATMDMSLEEFFADPVFDKVTD